MKWCFLLQRAVVGISESTKSDLDSLLREVKKEQGTAEVSMPSGSGGGASVFSHVMPQASPISRKRLSRDPTLDAALQQELKIAHETSRSSYQKLQVSKSVLFCTHIATYTIATYHAHVLIIHTSTL